jgi:hypothetical protein
MKTPLQELIERLQELREKFDTTDEILAVQRCIRKAHELLPYERERIEEAFNAGRDFGHAMGVGRPTYGMKFKDYYETTYGNESTSE